MVLLAEIFLALLPRLGLLIPERHWRGICFLGGFRSYAGWKVYSDDGAAIEAANLFASSEKESL